jgi:hypothetical protein
MQNPGSELVRGCWLGPAAMDVAALKMIDKIMVLSDQSQSLSSTA